jgi:hypothetical protein
MNKKSGTAGTPVEPTAPVAAHEADKADPGEVEKVKAEQRKTQTGKYGSVKTKPFKPADDDGGAGSGAGPDPASEAASDAKSDEKKLSWIEIELVGEDNKPIPGEKYLVTLPDNTVQEGTLDQNGWARLEGFEDGDCKIAFPDLDEEAWEFLKSAGAKTQ